MFKFIALLLKKNFSLNVFCKLFILFFSFILLNQLVFAQELYQRSTLDILNDKLQQRALSDKIPVYSYNQCAIGNCPPYVAPSLDEFFKETPVQEQPVTMQGPNKPIENATLPEKKPEYKAIATKKNITENDYKNIEPSVASLKINSKLSYDFEVITWPNGIVSVPVKTFAELLDIPVFVNHVDNSVSFTQPGTGNQVNINVKNSKVMLGSQQIDVRNPRIIYKKEGFLVNDDVYIPEQLARYLLDVKTNFLPEKFTMNVDTSRVLKAIVEMDNEMETPNKIYEEPLTKVNTAEKENKVFKVKRLDYNINSSLNKTSSENSTTSEQNTNLTIGSRGNFLGGVYTLGTSTFFNKSGIGLSGYTASLDYIGTQKQLSLGSIGAGLSTLAVPGTNLIGAKFGTLGAVNNSSSIPRIISGRADNNTLVELFINDIYTDKQAVENGRFDFDSMNYPTGSFVKIRVEQINQDNTRKVIYDREFSQDKDLLAPGQNEYMVFSGMDNSITSRAIKLFGDKTQEESSTPIKYTSGFKFKRGLTKKLTMGINFANSFNFSKPSNLLSSGVSSSPRVYRQSTTTSGSVATVGSNYAMTPDLRLSSEVGMSSASSLSPYEIKGTDAGGFVGFDYDKKQYNLSGKVFNYGSNFYSGSYSDTVDKRGLELGGVWNLDNNVSITGNVIKYNSNLDSLFNGGLSDIMNYNLSVGGAIDEKSTIRLGVRSASAANSLFSDDQTDLNIAYNRKLSDKVNLMLDFINSKNKNTDYANQAESGMTNKRINANLDIDAGKAGTVRIAHEVITLTPIERMVLASQSNYKQNPVNKSLYIKLDRSNKPFKRFTFSPNFGYRYTGDNKGMLFGMGLGYDLSKERRLMLNYSYNSVFARYNNLNYLSGNSSHTLSLNLVDSLNFGETGTSTSALDRDFSNSETAMIKGSVFLDINQNGTKDPDEEGVGGIDVKVKNMYTVTTDKKGFYVAPRLVDGVQIIGVDKDNLAFIYSPTGNDIAVNVKRGRVYVANFGIIIIPGSISGKVDVKKDDKSNSDVIILLLDKDNKEVKYTTTDSTGNYYIGAIPPGEYKVVVDKNYLDYNGLQASGKNPEYNVSVPFVKDDFVDIKDIDFKLIEKQTEVKSF